MYSSGAASWPLSAAVCHAHALARYIDVCLTNTGACSAATTNTLRSRDGGSDCDITGIAMELQRDGDDGFLAASWLLT
jgi:hypothetical protein